VTAPPLPVAVQATFDELGTPLRDTTFVVVDLETTGGSTRDCAITEIGAVKVRGGEVLGEFQTLVQPGEAIPPFIAVLTGITDAMVATAPRLETALPAFLDFARGAVLVAHNAPFDLGFLRAGCEQLGLDWPAFESVDTARLARRVLTRDEAPDCKLSSLARLFRAQVTPCHRALADAQATVDVLHGLVERLGNLGVHSLEELRTFSAMVTPAQRRKRHLADALPTDPGVYLFRDARDRVLYVGKSVNLRSRVRQYFTASEMRTRMAEMVGLAERVDPVVCATTLEAEVRELRLIAEHRPRYNRRSKFPEKAVWVKLTDEAFPRLSLVRRVLDDGCAYLGPFSSTRAAEAAVAAVHEAVPLRQCTKRLSPRRATSACVLAELGRCGAPCELRESVEEYADHVAVLRSALTGDPGVLVARLEQRIEALSAAQRFEDAAAQRDRLASLLRALARQQRAVSLTSVPELVAARPTADLGWELAVVRHGRLVAAGTVPRGARPGPYVDALLATAEVVRPAAGPLPASTAEEVACVLRWLGSDGVRLVRLDGTLCSPAFGAAGRTSWLDAVDDARAAARPFDDRRGLRPVARPARATA
jgi:DNA polymerase III subunit epsilon